jgi:hypothetical protein
MNIYELNIDNKVCRKLKLAHQLQYEQKMKDEEVHYFKNYKNLKVD